MKIFLLDDDQTLPPDMIKLASKVKMVAGKPTDLKITAHRDLRQATDYLFGNQADKAGHLDDFDLFLIDYYLDKGESGISLIKAIREANAKVPIVLFTSYDNSKNAFEAGMLGATTFSLKEDLISPDNFKGLIENAITRSKTGPVTS